MEYIITTEHLTKKYKDFVAACDISLHIQKGGIYGFLGSNGAGKSTIMKMLLGLTAPTEGSFTINRKHFPKDSVRMCWSWLVFQNLETVLQKNILWV